MDKKEKLLQKRVAGLFALLCVIFFQFFDSDHLFLKEEVVSVASLPEVLVGYWGKPAWLACSMAKVLTSLFVCSCRWRGGFDYSRVDAGMVGFFIYSAEIQCREYGSFVCSVSGYYGVGNLL